MKERSLHMQQPHASRTVKNRGELKGRQRGRRRRSSLPIQVEHSSTGVGSRSEPPMSTQPAWHGGLILQRAYPALSRDGEARAGRHATPDPIFEGGGVGLSSDMRETETIRSVAQSAAMACKAAAASASPPSVAPMNPKAGVRATAPSRLNLLSQFHGQGVLSVRQNEISMSQLRSRSSKRAGSVHRAVVVCKAAPERTVVIGLAADSGCGKSTFMRRLTSVFGGAASPPRGGNPDSNTLLSDTTTVICLDDYHSLDRFGRKEKAVTALDPRANNFDLMYEQVKALKEGKSVQKPIYNHVSGLLDPPELINPPNILVIEGLHPMYDARVRELLDFSIYLDISDDVKFAWKIQRDMAERGHSLESIKASIAARKPDFDAYIDPQKQYADVVIQVLPTQLIPDDNEGKVLRVRMVMKEGVKYFEPVYLYDEGSTISWIPCGRKLTCSYPGIKFFYGPDTYFGNEVSVVEMDGQFDKLDELIYVESHLSNISTKFYGEITQQMLKHADFPGSNNGTGLFQTIVGLKIRDVYERILSKEAATLEASKV